MQLASVSKLLTRTARAHRCRPQNCFLSARKSLSKWCEVFPLIACITRLGPRCGGTLNNRCTCSGRTCPFRISMLFVRQISLTSSRTRIATSPRNIGLRYFGMNTK